MYRIVNALLAHSLLISVEGSRINLSDRDGVRPASEADTRSMAPTLNSVARALLQANPSSSFAAGHLGHLHRQPLQGVGSAALRTAPSRAYAEPGAPGTERLVTGDLIEAKVTQLKYYGAFVQTISENPLYDGIEALLHHSEISLSSFTDVSDILSVGQGLKCVVLPEREYSSSGKHPLSTKRLEEEPGDMIRNPDKVFANAEKVWKDIRAAEEKEEEEVAEAFKEINSMFEDM